MDTSPVSIIIPVWNLWEITRGCLVELRKSTPANLFKVTVVDNGSSDDTAQMLQALGDALFPGRFKRIRLPENRGFAVACNLGASGAETPYLLFLNNDTVPRPGWLEPLIQAMENRADDAGQPAGVGPLLLFPDDARVQPESPRVQHCGIALSPTERFIHMYQHFPADHPAVLRPRRWQALTAACLLVERENFAGCGGFFEGYRNGLEDIDLCARLTAGGQSFRCVPESTVLHLESQTPGRNLADLENYALLKRRSFGAFTPDMQAIAEADGMRVRLSELLEVFLELSPERLTALQATAGTCAAHELKPLLARNPAWRQGYARLAAELAAQNPADSAGVLATLRLESALFPGLEAFERLRAAAGKHNAPALRLFAARQLKIRRQLAENPQAIEHAAAQYAERAKLLGFTGVQALFEEWEREHQNRHPPRVLQPGRPARLKR